MKYFTLTLLVCMFTMCSNQDHILKQTKFKSILINKLGGPTYLDGQALMNVTKEKDIKTIIKEINNCRKSELSEFKKEYLLLFVDMRGNKLELALGNGYLEEKNRNQISYYYNPALSRIIDSLNNFKYNEEYYKK